MPPPPSSSGNDGTAKRRRQRRRNHKRGKNPKNIEAASVLDDSNDDLCNTLLKVIAENNAHDENTECPPPSASTMTSIEDALKNCSEKNINARNTKGKVPLVEACYKGSMEIVKLLIKYGADINVRDSKDTSPLEAAAQQCHLTLVTYLLQIKELKPPLLLERYVLQYHNQSKTVFANASSHVECLTVILQHLTKLHLSNQILENQNSNNGWNALHFAAFVGSPSLFKFIFEYDSVQTRSMLKATAHNGKSVISVLSSSFMNVSKSQKKKKNALEPATASTKDILSIFEYVLKRVEDYGCNPVSIFDVVHNPSWKVTRTALHAVSNSIGINWVTESAARLCDKSNGSSNASILKSIGRLLGEKRGVSVTKCTFEKNVILWIFKTIQGHHACPDTIFTWSCLFSEYFNQQRKWTCDQSVTLDLLQGLVKSVAQSGKKLIYGISDLKDEDGDYDVEIEFFRFHTLFDMFLRLFAALGPQVTSDGCCLFDDLVEPLNVLFDRVYEALTLLHSEIEDAQRFGGIVFLKQVCSQVSAFCNEKEQPFTMLQKYIPKSNPNVRKWESVFSNALSRKLVLPKSFEEWVRPLGPYINILLRSDDEMAVHDLYGLLSVPGIVNTEYRIAFLERHAETKRSEFVLGINRVQDDTLEFILQQFTVATVSALSGDMSVSFVHEPGLGIGPLRELFNTVKTELFGKIGQTENNNVGLNTTKPLGESDFVKPSVVKAGKSNKLIAQWLQNARQQQKVNTDRPLSKRIAFEFFDKEEQQYVAIKNRLFKDDVVNSTDGFLQEKSRSKDNIDDLAFRAVGRIIGMSIRYGEPLGITFPLAFWKLLLGQTPTWDEYCEGDSMMKKSMKSLLCNPVTDLDLDFECTESAMSADNDDGDGSAKTVTYSVKLGNGEKVTEANKEEFVNLQSKRFFYKNVKDLYDALMSGINDVVKHLNLFTPKELQKITKGEDVVDFETLRNCVCYGGFTNGRRFNQSHPIAIQFWQVVSEFDQELLSKLLLFWSGSSKPPLFGFRKGSSSGGNDDDSDSDDDDIDTWTIYYDSYYYKDYCPRANTCNRRIMLSAYSSKEKLKQLLLAALKHGSVGYEDM